MDMLFGLSFIAFNLYDMIMQFNYKRYTVANAIMLFLLAVAWAVFSPFSFVSVILIILALWQIVPIWIRVVKIPVERAIFLGQIKRMKELLRKPFNKQSK
jgi:hypothetical protein